jgi:hypothetical protein
MIIKINNTTPLIYIALDLSLISGLTQINIRFMHSLIKSANKAID